MAIAKSNLKNLEGKTVLVSSSADRHNPPVGLRGSIRVLDTGELNGGAKVEIVLKYPDMFNQPARERIIVLNEMGLNRLLASEDRGAFQLTVDESLE